MPPRRDSSITPAAQRARADPAARLGYLLKHARATYLRVATQALAPLGVSHPEWAAMIRFGDDVQRSQAEVAQLLGIDRTSMVAVIDQLERKGLVQRRPHGADRRKNIVELTAAGRDLEQRAWLLIEDCERQLLAPLGSPGADQLRSALSAIIAFEG